MEEPKTHNHKFIPDGDGNCTSRPATKKEITEGRKKVRNSKGEFGFRSCYECNTAHAHLMEDFVFNCFACGRWFADGVDVMDYGKAAPQLPKEE